MTARLPDVDCGFLIRQAKINESFDEYIYFTLVMARPY